MGEIIRSDADDDDIIADGKTTLTRAIAKGGKWKELAEEKLPGVLLVVDNVKTNIAVTTQAFEIADADVDAYDGDADDFLKAKSDEMWNLVGRPAFDPAYALVWPGGASTYTEGRDEKQPDRMELLAELLDVGLHPKLDQQWGKNLAIEVRARATIYRQKLAPLTAAKTKLELLGKAKGVFARATQMELSRLKRLYKAAGFTEAEIHHVIPDRPRSKAKPEAPPKDPT